MFFPNLSLQVYQKSDIQQKNLTTACIALVDLCLNTFESQKIKIRLQFWRKTVTDMYIVVCCSTE